MNARHGVACAGLVAVGLLAGCTVEAEPRVSATALGRPPVSASLHGWTIRSQVEPGADPGSLRATVTFADNGLGGLRSGGTCLVADLGLGPCNSVQDCLDAASARALPGNGGADGWWHYCVAAGPPDLPRDAAPRCWTRPGRQANLCMVGPGARPGDIRGVEKRVTGLPHLDASPRPWTSLSCLAGGIAADTTTIVGDPTGCARQTDYVYAVDRPFWVSGQ
jgi:hypothetical protein